MVDWKPIASIPETLEDAIFKMNNGNIIQAENFPHHGGWHYSNCFPQEFENAKPEFWCAPEEYEAGAGHDAEK